MYKKGLVFGKFMPLHQGHLALIDFAALQCERLVVSMSYTPHDPIPPDTRLAWLQATFSKNPAIELAAESDDFHHASLPLEEATKHWATFIKYRFPEIEAFFCSEKYGEPLAQHLGLPCIYFDIDRQQVPISGTQIRQNPFSHWRFITPIVRPYFVKKVCLYGPESVGKTTMARQLATRYQTCFVHEVARDMLTTNVFSLADIERIGYAQTHAVQEAEKQANKVLFCDTDVITTQLYSMYYLQGFPPLLQDLEQQVVYDLYFLLDIDVPWVADGLRDLGHKRQEMYELFKAALDQRGIEYVKVSGDWDTRLAIIEQEIEKRFGVVVTPSLRA